MKHILPLLILLVALKVGATTWQVDGSSTNNFGPIWNELKNWDTVLVTNNCWPGTSTLLLPNNVTFYFNGNGLMDWGGMIITNSVANSIIVTNFVFSITNRYGLFCGGQGCEGYKPWYIVGCKFTTPISVANIGIATGPGVFSYNTVTNCMPFIQFMEPIWNGANGTPDDGWTGIAVVPGTNDQLYVEHNIFVNTNGGTYDGSCIMQAQYGSRIVVRDNVVFNMMFEIHGSCGAIYGRWWEFYNNICTNAQFCLRGGSGYIYNNTGTAGFFTMGTECNVTYPALYQIGRGINQTLVPAHVWNNDAGIGNPVLNGSGYCATFIANMVTLNVDVYETSVSYTPYTDPYPFPQQSAGPTPVLMVIPGK